MVSPKSLAELRRCVGQLRNHAIDANDYHGGLGDAVFEITTIETFVVGVASSLLDGESVEPHFISAISAGRLKDQRWWLTDKGKTVDLAACPSVLEYAIAVENTRAISLQVAGKLSE